MLNLKTGRTGIDDDLGTGQKRDRAAANRAIREADWNSLRTRYEAGESSRALAAEVGVAVTTMQIRLGGRGTRMRTGSPPATLTVSDTDLRAAYAAGATITALAAQYGCSTSLIWRRLHFDLPPRERRPGRQRTAGPGLAAGRRAGRAGRESAEQTGRSRAGTGEDEKEPAMAQRVTVLLEDDLDGTAADQTVAFSLDGTDVRDRPQRRPRRPAAVGVGAVDRLGPSRRRPETR